MKRFYFLFYFLVLIYGSASAQQIDYGEYFIDADPGVGNGDSISFTSADSIDIPVAVSTSGYLPGFHFLSTRFKDSNGNWGITESRSFYVYDTTNSSGNSSTPLTSGEYFIDADPGVGNGDSISFPSADSIDIPVSVSTSGLLPGFHFLNTRFKD